MPVLFVKRKNSNLHSSKRAILKVDVSVFSRIFHSISKRECAEETKKAKKIEQQVFLSALS
jgi:hypothetical protein